MTRMQSSSIPPQGVSTRQEAPAMRERGTTTQETDAPGGWDPPTRGGRFATRVARHQALARTTPSEKHDFWAEEARRCEFTLGKF